MDETIAILHAYVRVSIEGSYDNALRAGDNQVHGPEFCPGCMHLAAVKSTIRLCSQVPYPLINAALDVEQSDAQFQADMRLLMKHDIDASNAAPRVFELVNRTLN